MPIYEFVCDNKKCGAAEDVIITFAAMKEKQETPDICIHCTKGFMMKQVSTPVIETAPYGGARRRLS